MNNKAPKKILVVEDEVKIAQLICEYLTREGFDSLAVHDGAEVSKTVEIWQPDVMLLDIQLPGKDGMTICKEIKASRTLPILMLTARVDEIDRIDGLEVGADDYICKPFSPREIAARVRTVLRRVDILDKYLQQQNEYTTRTKQKSIIIFGKLELDHFKRSVRFDGKVIDLEPMAFDLLQLFAQHPRRVLAKTHVQKTLQQLTRQNINIDTERLLKSTNEYFHPLLGGQSIIISVYNIAYRLNMESLM